ncbi:HD domain-containing protein [Actinocorallia sp. API 0066]|uniref:HD domain-containing protein n=1 Tax=Actinocorallia sp. API 0066 TaxID=2896846 RepID=UPI001E2E6F32|nr:HD domain-containing protein [Actinocorallia sp. API 0066]MCD0448086.1 HD domain-containing protein [Actinocorallia sp. API 0066]
MDLLERWAALTGPDTRRLGADLLERYAEPHRHYHTTAHLVAVLDLVDELADEAADPDAVRLAAWFHDAVYDPRRDDNEERSARLAERMLADTTLAAARAAHVAALVRMTKTHDPQDADGRVLCDADLAILAADGPTYTAYTTAVRAEYSFVPDEYFVIGRADVLEQLLGLPALFHTASARARFDAKARANLTAELAALRTSAAAAPSGGGAPAAPGS